MPKYNRVHNTAKNGKLLRNEIREYVLAMSLYYGLKFSKKVAKEIFGSQTNRIKQCTFLNITIDKNLLFRGMPPVACDDLINLPFYLAETFKSYFKLLNQSILDSHRYYYSYYDTKKLRCYRDRLQYGVKRRIRLNHTMQYLWTPALLCVLFSLGDWYYNESGDDHILDLSDSWMALYADNIAETADYLYTYILHTFPNMSNLTDLKVTCSPSLLGVCNPILKIHMSDECYNLLWTIVNTEAVNIHRKLLKGGYVIGN